MRRIKIRGDGCFAVGALPMAVALLLLAGCGHKAANRYDLSGKVTYRGAPVPVGYILFVPDVTKGNQGVGTEAPIVNGVYKTLPTHGTIGGPHVATIAGFDSTKSEADEKAMRNPRSRHSRVNRCFPRPRGCRLAPAGRHARFRRSRAVEGPRPIQWGPTMAHRLRSACCIAAFAVLLPARHATSFASAEDACATGFASAAGPSMPHGAAAEKREALAKPVAHGDDAARPSPPPRRGVLIRFEGFIGLGNELYLRRKLETARRQGADLVIIEIDSPGGQLDASEAIAGTPPRRLLGPYRGLHSRPRVQRSRGQSRLGCDEIVAAPNAILGDVGALS